MSNMKKKFRSCFIVDVQIDVNCIVLSDSQHNSYYIDINDEDVKKQFAVWFKDTFQQGVSQTLTVFEYKTIDISECETEMHIVKFINSNKLV